MAHRPRDGLAHDVCRAREPHAPGESDGFAEGHASGRVSDQGGDYDEATNRIVVHVPGLQQELLEEIRSGFEAASGIDLKIQEQLAFSFL